MVTLQVGKCLHGFRVSRFQGVAVSGYHGYGNKIKNHQSSIGRIVYVYICICVYLYMCISVIC